MILFIFTNTYPYDAIGERTFLSGEIKILNKYFERIILVPQESHGHLLPLPKSVDADLSFAKHFTFANRIFSFLPFLFSKDLYLDIKDHFPDAFSLAYLKKLFFFLSGARLTQNWLKNWIQREGVSASNVICYSYWFTEIAMGLGWVKNRLPQLRVISRAHGYDLYEELYKPWPFRLQSISMLDGLYAVSDTGTNYLHKKYPQFSDKYATALLGVPSPGEVSKPSTDGVLRIVSCSMINPIKRLDLLFQGVVTAAKMRKEQKIEWTHFGGGAERQVFIDRASSEFPPNAKGHFPGYQTQQHLIQTYLDNPVDVFVNVSSTEGTPVSIMEAISCGIPVIATSVGGNVEIVKEKNGFLLGENPTPGEIAETLLKVCDQRGEMLKKRQASLEVWSERYNEAENFEAFAQKLVEIRKR
jgi:colanic acid/amylovoran biosynthesis glycosyltransferase